MGQPLVSVIIPTYNRKAYLREAINSVANQTYSEIEIRVIDDGSDENYAQAICESFSNCFYHYKKNNGVSSSRNYGVQNAKGEFIAFLDDDDLWKKDKIERQVKLLLEQPNVDLIHSGAIVIDEKGEPTGEVIGASKSKIEKRSGHVFWNALAVWTVKASTPLFRKRIFGDLLVFDERLKAGEDADFYQRLFYKHAVWYMEEPMAYYRVYLNANRLSVQSQLYNGLEPIMFENIVQMRITNPITLNRIARRILTLAINNWKKKYPEKSLRISKFNKFFRPQFCLNNFFKEEQCA